MIWDILILATVETGIRLVDGAGFGASTLELKDYLLKTEETSRRQAFQQALDKGMAAARDGALETLLGHGSFQEAVVQALLDPQEDFNLRVAGEALGADILKHTGSLRRFFAALQTSLNDDPIWGPLFKLYQDLRLQQDIREAFQARQLPTSDAELVSAVSKTTDQYTANLSGEGAIAQGTGAKAVGARGTLIEGDVQQIVQITLKQFVTLGGPAETSMDLERRYLRLVADQANLLKWVRISTEVSDPSAGQNLQLDEVYIDLDATETLHAQTEEEFRQSMIRQHGLERTPVLAFVNNKSRLLIMGDPGSGKSTFVRYLAYLMAQARLAAEPTPWLERLPSWESGALLPVRLDLRYISAGEEWSSDPAKLLLHHLHTELSDWGLDEYWPILQAAIQDKEEEVLFLLDGLDEVPADRRHLVVEAINELCELQPQHRYIVTCRPYAYLGQAWALSSFYEITLAGFDDDQIDLFIENWYGRLAKAGAASQAIAERKAQHLKDAVRQQGLFGLAARPILLAVMAQLHAHTGRLPEERTQLFADAVDLLLQRWEGPLKTGEGILKHLNIPGLKMSDLEAGMYDVAFRAHRANPVIEETAEIAEGQLRSWLSHYINDDWNKAGDFISYIRERAGLLIRYKADAYTFPHRSFQEFLSACYWLSMDDYPSKATELTLADWDRWHEVFLLSTGYAARTKRLGQAIAAVNFLLPRSIGEVHDPQQSDWRNAILAGQALLEIGLVGLRRELAGRVLLERAQNWLVCAIGEDAALDARLRVQAGYVLAGLGDPRNGVLMVEDMEFCHVPSGEFACGDEENLKTATLPDFWIAKYPVTNAQYQQFVDAEGYKQPQFWDEAISAGAWKDGQIRNLWDEARSSAPDLTEPYNLPNHPIVGITWFEARAFARWLDEYLRELAKSKVGDEAAQSYWRSLAEGTLRIELPEELQWEKAARGTDGRLYPWLGDLDTNRANAYETGINSTNAVGCFPSGMSPCGALEMSGNVWEWTASEESSLRVLKGGSFYDSFTTSRCYVRDAENPRRYDWSIGFRVVLSPVLRTTG